MDPGTPLTTPLSHALVAFTIEFDNEFERRFSEAGGGARVASVVMWSNFLRFVGDGITVGALPGAAGLPKALIRSMVGGMERWRYVAVGPAGEPVTARRDGYGSGSRLRSDWVVRLTPAGRTAGEIWRPLFAEIETRWEERFGATTVEELSTALRTIADQLEEELPEYLPIVGTANGMAVDLPPRERRGGHSSHLHLAALLAQVLLAHAIDFERKSELSLPLSANCVRVLDETAMTARDLAVTAGVSDQATSMALRYLEKQGYVEIDAKLVRLTPRGIEARERSRRRHTEVERVVGDPLRRRHGGRGSFGAREGARPTRRALARAQAAPRRLAREQAVSRAHQGDGRRPDRSAAPLSDGPPSRRLARRQLSQSAT